ncbi:phage portal protein [Paenibacillaceae bacterium]|nr:phage portal protein [Paenibacillaceae bacterium]
MMSLQAFFAQNVQSELTEEFVVSERFKEDNGASIKWELKTLTESENEMIRKSATRSVKGKNGARSTETNPEDYVAKLAVASVVYPDLQSADLQQSYGVMGADNLLKKMLLSGEYANLLAKVQELNGFDRDINDMAEEVKN